MSGGEQGLNIGVHMVRDILRIIAGIALFYGLYLFWKDNQVLLHFQIIHDVIASTPDNSMIGLISYLERFSISECWRYILFGLIGLEVFRPYRY